MRDRYDKNGNEKPSTLVQGAKNDQGKARFELIPGELLWAIATVLTFGAIKYADRNWEKGISWGRVFGALMRHMWAWWQGKGPTSKSFLFGDLDPETKFSHLWHAAACLAFLIAYEERGMTGFDDRPKAQADLAKKDTGKPEQSKLDECSSCSEAGGIIADMEEIHPTGVAWTGTMEGMDLRILADIESKNSVQPCIDGLRWDYEKMHHVYCSEGQTVGSDWDIVGR